MDGQDLGLQDSKKSVDSIELTSYLYIWFVVCIIKLICIWALLYIHIHTHTYMHINANGRPGGCKFSTKNPLKK